MLGSKAKFARKKYGIIAIGIPIPKIDLERIEEINKKIIAPYASMCAGIRIETIFWLSVLRKDKHILSLVIEVDNAKIANMLIVKELVLNHTLHRCMRYNPACKIK